MTTQRPHPTLFTALLTALVLTACASNETAAPLAIDDAAAATPAAASPINERDRARAASWAKAIRGLDFDSGFVVVENPALTRDRTAANAWMGEGAQFLQNNRKTSAVGAYASAVRADPRYVDAYLGLGQAMMVKGKIDLAAASYRTALQLDARNVEARYGLADMLAREQQRDEAIAEMQALLDVSPDYARAHERLAIWQYYEGEHAAAWQHVHAARDLNHRMPPQFIVLLEGQMADPGSRP